MSRPIRRSAYLALCLTALLATLSFFVNGNRVNAVSLTITTEDLAEHGLVLISSQEEGFEERATAITRDKNEWIFEALKPWTVILENRADKTLLGYSVKWRITTRKGTAATKRAAFLGLGEFGWGFGAAPSLQGGAGIAPGTRRLVSIGSSLGEGETGRIGGVPAGLTKAGAPVTEATLLDSLKAELQDSVAQTVSIDGALFEDGTFVGPDTTSFFARVRAQLDARRDLAEEILFGLARRGEEDAFAGVRELLAQNVNFGPEPGYVHYYNSYKRFFAEGVLRMRERMGLERLLSLLRSELQAPRPDLRKVPFVRPREHGERGRRDS